MAASGMHALEAIIVAVLVMCCIQIDGVQSACPSGYTTCNAKYPCRTSVKTDVNNCGACGVKCPSGPHGKPTCKNGECGYKCDRSWSDCDPTKPGCETYIDTDPLNCGQCGISCPVPTLNSIATCSRGDCGFRCKSDTKRCGNKCILVNTDADNCGSCNNVCRSPPNSNAYCSGGRCAFNCDNGFFDCDGKKKNGCEVDLNTDVSNCGRCKTQCPTVANAKTICKNGGCDFTCDDGYGDCDRDATNGCEVALKEDPLHCGTCETECPAVANAKTICKNGGCDFTCDDGYGDCDRDATNGCEVALKEDPLHCGTCETECPAVANAVTICKDGGCDFTCKDGYGDCDRDATNGCEVALKEDPLHCGTCETECPAVANAKTICKNGGCDFTCDDGYGDCDRDATNGCEVALKEDPLHCGTCETECPAVANAVTICKDGGCDFTCKDGYGDCDRDATNGCEVALKEDPLHCGTCETECPAVANAKPICKNGGCDFTCDDGYGDCDRDATNGCEVALKEDPLHCGTCETECPAVANAVTICKDGGCDFTCKDGYGDCDRDATNGCEVALKEDPLHCGTCETECPAVANAKTICKDGGCDFTCNDGYGDCDRDATNGCEVALKEDPLHCGTCETECPAVANAVTICKDGGCDFTCKDGYGDCDRDATNGCEVALKEDPLHCGTCVTECPAVANAKTICKNGGCDFTCDDGYGDCDRDATNGCEVELEDDPLHCGTCETECPAVANAVTICKDGGCDFTCKDGYGDCDRDATNGCEVALKEDPLHCGTCVTECPAVANAKTICKNGGCDFTCDDGYGDCDRDATNGCEVELEDDPLHCGTCETECPAVANAVTICKDGGCDFTCNDGYTDCDNDPRNGCECPSRANAETTCRMDGACGFTCKTGYGDCDGKRKNGCEVDLNKSLMNCGACDNDCRPAHVDGATCLAGTCGYTTCVSEKWGDCDEDPANGCETKLSTSSNCGKCGKECPGVGNYCKQPWLKCKLSN